MSYACYLGLTETMWCALRDAVSHWRLCNFTQHTLATLEALERRGYTHVKLDDTGRYIWRVTALGQRLRDADESMSKGMGHMGPQIWLPRT